MNEKKIKLEIKGLEKKYVSKTKEVVALNGIDLAVKENEFVAIVGPSGCGKSTMLNIVAGLLEQTNGEVYCNGKFIEGTSRFAVICPGGGYEKVCDFNSGKPVAKELNKRGISAFVLRYHTKDKGRFPIPQNELALAVKRILDKSEKYNVEKDGYSVWGFSAGGHLAGCFGTDNMGYLKHDLPKPKAIILSYPVTVMNEFGHIGSRDNLLGENPSQELIDETTLTKHVGTWFPPTYIWTTKGDELVDPINSFMLFDELQKNKIKSQFRFIEDEKLLHGLALAKGTKAETWFDEALNFWIK